MNEITKKHRIEQLKAMDQFIASADDEAIQETWMAGGVPDCASEDDFDFIAGNDEEYRACVRLFKKLTQDSGCYY